MPYILSDIKSDIIVTSKKKELFNGYKDATSLVKLVVNE